MERISMDEWASSEPDRLKQYYALSVVPQRKFQVIMTGRHGDVSIVLTAGSIDTVIDQVKGRRIATPPGMTGFRVTELTT